MPQLVQNSKCPKGHKNYATKTISLKEKISIQRDL